jgi:hypothetical protein
MYRYQSLNPIKLKSNKYPHDFKAIVTKDKLYDKLYDKFNTTELINMKPPFLHKQEMRTFTTYNKHKTTEELIANNTLMGCFPVEGCEMSNIQRDLIITQKQKKESILALLRSEVMMDEKVETLEGKADN